MALKGSDSLGTSSQWLQTIKCRIYMAAVWEVWEATVGEAGRLHNKICEQAITNLSLM